MDNHFIYGIHEPPPMSWLVDHMMLDGQAAGWIVHTHELGHDPSVRTGYDYTRWANAGWGQIARLNNGYHPNGTIPLDPLHYDGFAARCAWWAVGSQGCNHWIVGNEPNCSVEGMIPVERYIECFRKVYPALKVLDPEAVIMPAPVAMWNAESGDWLDYYRRMLLGCWPFDALCWHTYTHGSEPELIRDMTTMAPPYGDRLYHFRAYWDLWEATPAQFAHLPVYITETDQGDVGGVRQPWLDEPGVTWVQEAYREIDEFNRGHGYPIRCLALYRWPRHDEWHIEGKPWVHLDLKEAVEQGYTWKGGPVNGWSEVFRTSMDEGFYDYEGSGELTVPIGSVPLYEHDGEPKEHLSRPEYDQRAEPHVHTAPNAAGFFCMNSTMEAAIVYEIVGLAPGTEVRASAWAMAQDAAGSGLGMRVGLATEDPGEGAIDVETPDGKFTGALEDRAVWGEWQADVTDGHWEQLWTPVVVATGARVWVLLNGRADWADPAHTHWDDLIVEVRGSQPVPPPNGEHTIRVETYFDDHLVSSSTARVDCGGQINAQVCDLARQIEALTCPGE